MIRIEKIKGSAMQFAILVSTIVLVLLGSFMTLTHAHKFFKIQSKFLLNTIDASNYGIEYGLNPKNSFLDSISIENGLLNVSLKREFWGGYERLNSKASVKSKSFSKIGLTGSQVTNPKTSIVIGDNSLPLVLVGNTRIEGTAYISDKGVKPGTIAGNYFNGDQLINGAIKQSHGELPRLHSLWIKNVKRLMDYVPSNMDEVIEPIAIQQNSFFNKTKYVYHEKTVLLFEQYIGNIIVISTSEIIVTKLSKLTDVTLIAPKITIEKGFNGVVHLIASDELVIEDGVLLEYPSSITLVKSDSTENPPQVDKTYGVLISSGCVVRGNLIYLSSEANNLLGRNTITGIRIEEMSTVEGSVYCDGNLELSGTVKGSVYTERFTADASGSRYVNHIYNGAILGNDIDSNYCGLPFANTKKGVVKWLY